ncbi:hypothetical protein [Geopseudomonas aromaticivorans]
MAAMSRNLSKSEADKALNDLLENDFWVDTLSTDEFYSRLHDDRDGHTTIDHALTVAVASDADLHVMLPNSMESLRFRSYFGGGKSPRVRNALMVLAEAIRRDNAECPRLNPSNQGKR